MKVYKVLEDYFCVHSKESLYLKKEDILIMGKCSVLSPNGYTFVEVDLLTKLIREDKKKTVNIVEPKLTQYGLLPSGYKYDFEVAKLGIKERISGTLNGYYESKPIEDITVQYLRDIKLKELL